MNFDVSDCQCRSFRVWPAFVLGAFLLALACPRAAVAHGRLEDYDRDQAVFTYPVGRILNVELLKPPGYAEPGRELPLTIFLHGATDGRSDKRDRLNQTMADLLRATQGDNFERHGYCVGRCLPPQRAMFEQMAHAEDLAYSSFLLVPQIPETSSATGWGGNLDVLPDLINQSIVNYNIDFNRVYIVGYSDGGFATYTLMNSFPDQIAAAVPIAGGGNPNIAPTIKDIPTWIFHGTIDTVVSPNFATSMYDALVAAGGSPQLSLFPGVNHDSFAPAFRDANDEFYPWLFSQSLVPEPSSAWLLAAGLVCVGRSRIRRRCRSS